VPARSKRQIFAQKKSRTGSLYHLSHGQREPDGFGLCRRSDG
jgi:hypothetical protein